MTAFAKKYGPWALVTGASSGIGEEFARQLASKGLDLVLVARRKDRLEVLARELEVNRNVNVRVVQADLSTPEGIETVKEDTADLEVGLLVNNAGTAAGMGAFIKSDIGLEETVVYLNNIAPLKLAHHFAARMGERSNGGILFTSSTSAFQPTPYLANYAASKAYLLSLGEALNAELKPKGVDVTVLVPGATKTEMATMFDDIDMSKVRMNWMEVTPVVQAALNALGKRAYVVPGSFNKIMHFMAKRVLSSQRMSSVFANMMRPAIPAERL